MKSTKKSFLLSTISLVLCFAMLLGTTWAWFTDEVTSGTSRIVAGNLDIDLLMEKNGQYVSVANGQGDIFKEAANANNSTATLWEPGKTQFAMLAVENKGNLAVKYTAYIDVTDNGLASALEYAFVSFGHDKPDMTSFPEITSWIALKAAADSMGSTGQVTFGRQEIDTGVLDEIVNGIKNERDYVLLAVHMKEEAGNEYQGKEALIDVTIVATQKDAESDAFGHDYDAGATGKVPALPMHETASSKAIAMTGAENTITQIGGQAVTGNEEVEIKSGSTVATATVPVEAAQTVMTGLLSVKNADINKDREMVLNLNVDTTETKQASVTYDINVTADITYYEAGSETPKTETGMPVEGLTHFLTATINIGVNKENVKVTHDGHPMDKMEDATDTPTNDANGGYHYDKNSGILTIKSKTFSPFTVSFDLSNMPQFTVKGINPGQQDIWGVRLNSTTRELQSITSENPLFSMGKANVVNGISFSTAGELADEWRLATADFVISFDTDIAAMEYTYDNVTGYVLPIVPVGKFASDADWYNLNGKWLPCPLSGRNNGGTVVYSDHKLQESTFTYKAGTKIKLLEDVLNKGVNCRELFNAIKEFSCGVVFLKDVGTVNVTVELVVTENDSGIPHTISSQTFTINSSNVTPLGINSQN